MTSEWIRDIVHGRKPSSQLAHPRELIQQFAPNWFVATMSTGMLALGLPQLPEPGAALCRRTAVDGQHRTLRVVFRALWRAANPVRPGGEVDLRAQCRVDVYWHDPDGTGDDH